MHTAESGIRIFSFRIRQSEAQAAQLTYVQSTYGAGNLRKSGNETCMHIQYCRNAAKQVK